jgi:hypothetical protein
MVAGACLALAAAAAGAVLYVLFFTGGVVVRVINRTDFPLSDVRITYSGGERGTDLLESGENIAWRIHPADKSDVALSYYDNEGHREAHTSLEGKPTEGSISLIVGRDGVRTLDRTK